MENQDLDDWIILSSHKHVLFPGYGQSYPSNPEKFPWYQISGDRNDIIPTNGLCLLLWIIPECNGCG